LHAAHHPGQQWSAAKVVFTGRATGRRIAKELGLHRDTVARHIRACEPPSKQADAPIGSEEESAEAKRATPEGGAHCSKQTTFEGAPIGTKNAKNTN
jgi:hypothetical protein